MSTSRWRNGRIGGLLQKIKAFLAGFGIEQQMDGLVSTENFDDERWDENSSPQQLL